MAAIPPWGAMSRQRWTTLLKGDAEKTNRALSLSGVFDECMWVIGNPLASTLAVISGLLAFSFTGMCVVIGALMFLGCPFRMILRLAGGDLNALLGLAGFVCGILAGVFFLNKGYTLKRSHDLAKPEGGVFVILTLVVFALLLLAPASSTSAKRAQAPARCMRRSSSAWRLVSSSVRWRSGRGSAWSAVYATSCSSRRPS